MKKIFPAAFAVLIMFQAGALFAQLDTRLFLAWTRPDYSQQIRTVWGPLTRAATPSPITESGRLDFNNGGRTDGFAGGLVFAFPAGVGIELRLDSLRAAGYTETETTTRQDGVDTTAAFRTYGNGLNATPISLNVRFELFREAFLQPYISAGLTLFLGKYRAGMTRPFSANTLDALGAALPERWFVDYAIQDTVGGLGGNLGAGLALRFSRALSIFGEARLLAGPAREYSWTAVAKPYLGLLQGAALESAQLTDAQNLANDAGPIRVRLVFGYYAAGIRLVL